MDFTISIFGDFAKFKYGKMPKKSSIKENGKYPIYSGYRYVGYCDEYNTEANQLIIVARGVGGTGDVKLTREKCYLTNLSISAEIDSNVAIPQYLYYYFSMRNLRYLDSGSAQSQITISDLEKVRIPLPNIESQKKIVHCLSLTDNKISANESINNNLEQQVSILYQSWFEDFEISNGVCPEDWSYQELSSIADIASGKRPPVKSNVCNQETPISIVGAASVMGFTSEANHTDKILVTGRVGTHGVVQRFNTPCWTSDNTLVITSPYYEFTNQILHRIDYSSMNRGSTQPLITQGDMKKVVVLVPDENTLAKFEEFAGSLMAKWEANNKENVKLASLRDTLLPKLMSGELDVSNIEI